MAVSSAKSLGPAGRDAIGKFGTAGGAHQVDVFHLDVATALAFVLEQEVDAARNAIFDRGACQRISASGSISS